MEVFILKSEKKYVNSWESLRNMKEETARRQTCWLTYFAYATLDIPKTKYSIVAVCIVVHKP